MAPYPCSTLQSGSSVQLPGKSIPPIQTRTPVVREEQPTPEGLSAPASTASRNTGEGGAQSEKDMTPEPLPWLVATKPMLTNVWMRQWPECGAKQKDGVELMWPIVKNGLSYIRE